LAGKAYLLFLKYLKKEGYRCIECVSDEELAKLETTINEAMVKKILGKFLEN
jgi:hypothetical protein